MSAEAHVFTGSNARSVRAWVNEHPDRPDGESWFVTKSMAASTGGQAWRYVKADRDWPDNVAGAVYDPVVGDWLPVTRGQALVRDQDTGRHYVSEWEA